MLAPVKTRAREEQGVVDVETHRHGGLAGKAGGNLVGRDPVHRCLVGQLDHGSALRSTLGPGQGAQASTAAKREKRRITGLL